MTKTPPSKRAAIYVRISQNRDDDDSKPEYQRKNCTKFAKSKGFQIIGESYEDDDVSAYKGKTERPAYKRLLADIEGGKIDVVVTAEMQRLLRTTREMLDFIE